ncbi:MAG: ABC transporter substrate-binding protein [Deltaproteobacteria bacterium]|nr:ABC transporter substrate-binding protein [Deltaproteobacteria bacterium]
MDIRHVLSAILTPVLLLALSPLSVYGGDPPPPAIPSIGIAVEFTDHAACAYVAMEKGWFVDAGLTIHAYESYETGMALASALARGDIQAAYICLVPTINTHRNAKVPIRVVAGTHRYGYGLVVNPDRVRTVKDLENPSVRIGCVREGGAADVVMRKLIDTCHLDEEEVLQNVRRMKPSQQLLAMKTGQLDAAFMPEHWATMTERYGAKMLLTSRDIWPGMQGSVLVVREELIQAHPEIVNRLVAVTQRATQWLNHNREEAAGILARRFSVETKGTGCDTGEIDVQTLIRSMERIEFRTDIDPGMVQDTINYIERLGYIRDGRDARSLLAERLTGNE